MLKLIKRWLGWETDSGFYGDSEGPRSRPDSATAHLFAKDAATSGQLGSGRRGVHKAKGKPTAKPDPQFDPYNTGKFDRSASWERISKTQR